MHIKTNRKKLKRVEKVDKISRIEKKKRKLKNKNERIGVKKNYEQSMIICNLFFYDKLEYGFR